MAYFQAPHSFQLELERNGLNRRDHLPLSVLAIKILIADSPREKKQENESNITHFYETSEKSEKFAKASRKIKKN